MASLTPEQINDLARQLDEAETSRVQLRHFSAQFADMNIDDGYRISRAWVARKLERGQQVIGHKIGLRARELTAHHAISGRSRATAGQLDHLDLCANEVLEVPTREPRRIAHHHHVVERDGVVVPLVDRLGEHGW